jgi:5-methylcytosine-specific restriction enzyme subunit McrC
MTIPIQNLYYMICYAWDLLDFLKIDSTGSDRVHRPVDLLAFMLQQSCDDLLKRGISSEYIVKDELLQGVKGKLLVTETMQKCYQRSGRTVCRSDEYSANTLINQIVKSTLFHLGREPSLAAHLCDSLGSLERHWKAVTLRDLSTRDFRYVHLNRLNRHYSLTIRLCELIWQNFIPSDEPGRYIFESFGRDEHKLRYLYENFVRNFYGRELSNQYEVKRKSFQWALDSAFTENFREHLPSLNTDICLLSADDHVIVETKFVPETFSTRWGDEKLRSQHLYQLMSYLENFRRNFKVIPRGVLLYPTVRKDVDLNYNIWGMKVKVVTVDLSQKWCDIYHDLLEVVKSDLQPVA